MKCIIFSEEIKDSNINAGTTALLKEKGVFKGLVTITHLTLEGYWAIIGPSFNGVLPETANLCRLNVRDVDTDKVYPLKRSQWQGSIQLDRIDSNTVLDYELNDYPFKEGMYVNRCAECSDDFNAAKKQTLCKTCCKLHAEAFLINSTQEKPFKLKNNYKMKEIAFKAFVLGKNDPDANFEQWYSKFK